MNKHEANRVDAVRSVLILALAMPVMVSAATKTDVESLCDDMALFAARIEYLHQGNTSIRDALSFDEKKGDVGKSIVMKIYRGPAYMDPGLGNRAITQAETDTYLDCMDHPQKFMGR